MSVDLVMTINWKFQHGLDPQAHPDGLQVDIWDLRRKKVETFRKNKTTICVFATWNLWKMRKSGKSEKSEKCKFRSCASTHRRSKPYIILHFWNTFKVFLFFSALNARANENFLSWCYNKSFARSCIFIHKWYNTNAYNIRVMHIA